MLNKDKRTLSLRLRFSIVPPSEASPISVKLLALSVDNILQKIIVLLTSSECSKTAEEKLSYTIGCVIQLKFIELYYFPITITMILPTDQSNQRLLSKLS